MSATSTAVVSLMSISTDLLLHIYNYGIPMPQETGFFGSEKGLALAGTTTGISATAIAGGITSGELDSMVKNISSEYDKKLAKTMIASSVINVKMLSQAGVGFAYGLALTPDAFKSWASKQFVPSLFVHGAIAGIVPYWMN